jgi:uncharacterized protein (TIGR02246 family)
MNRSYGMYRAPVVGATLLIVAALIIACMPVSPMPQVNAQAAEPAGLEEQVDAIWQAYAESVTEGDAARFAALWTDDAIKLPPGAMPVEGAEAIEARFEASAGGSDSVMEINNKEIGHGPEFAFSSGFYSVEVTPTDGSEPFLVDGKYLDILRQQEDGTWKLYRDCYNSNVPPAAAAEPDVEAVTAEVSALFDEYVASLEAGDAERWSQLWVEDGVQSPPDAPPNVGRNAIFNNISAAMDLFAFEDMQINIDEVLVAGDLAIARGLYTVTYVPLDGSDPIPVDGKYTTTFQQQADGSWKIYRDIFNSNVPPAAAAEPDVEAVTAEIRTLFDEYIASLEAGDPERWTELWVEDGVQQPPGAPPNIGRDVIFSNISADLEQGTYEDFQIEIDEVLVAGDLAVARGLYTLTYLPSDGSDPILVDGKYTTTFQQQADGSWKIFRDIFNSNVP